MDATVNPDIIQEVATMLYDSERRLYSFAYYAEIDRDSY